MPHSVDRLGARAVATAGCAALAGAAALLLVAGAPHASAWQMLTLLVLAPIAEEVVFRAGMQETLLRRLMHPAWANGLTALAFAGVHVAMRGEVSAVMVVLPALLVGLVYQRGRRVFPCVVLHAAMNAIWLGWSLAASWAPTT